MDSLASKLGYLRGLAEGLGIDDGTKEGKVIRQMILLLDDIGHSIGELNENYEELFSYVETIDEDLSDLEEELLEDEDSEDFGDYDYDDDGDGDIFDEHGVSFTVECPECHYEVTIDEDILEDEESFEVLCPNCGKVVFINDDSDDDDDSEWDGDFDEFVDETTEEEKSD
ncbi:MAG TPA: AraC family transcriptional regulator [Firmicutes bacterium]|jgi:DNA-directed RNA polymerase subunit delta|nr:AraC family transcriptional regulator [Bacillota bacterium]